MATIKLVKDKRKKMQDNKFSLAIRVCHKSNVQYLSISKMTDIQESVNEFKTKCECIFSEMNSYNPKRFRELMYQKDKEIPKTLLLKDMFTYYIYNYEGITLKTRQHFKL
jgi:hypothetical protein